MYELLRFLHALAMIAAVGAAVLPTLVLYAVARASSPAGIQAVAPLALRARAAASPLIVVAAVFGAAAALIAGLNPMQPWLIARTWRSASRCSRGRSRPTRGRDG